MSFPKEPKDGGSPLKRDEHNALDRDDATKQTDELMKRLIVEERSYQKEIAFKHARGNRRDIVVKMVIYQRNTVNGKVVTLDNSDLAFEKLSDDPLDPYRYKIFDFVDGEISVNEMPMPMSKAGQFLHGCFRAVLNYLARMNIFNDV